MPVSRDNPNYVDLRRWQYQVACCMLCLPMVVLSTSLGSFLTMPCVCRMPRCSRFVHRPSFVLYIYAVRRYVCSVNSFVPFVTLCQSLQVALTTAHVRMYTPKQVSNTNTVICRMGRVALVRVVTYGSS